MVDCDGMGRAFPEIQMVTHTIYGIDATPMAMSDERGNKVMMETINQPLDRDLRTQYHGGYGRHGHDRALCRHRRAAQGVRHPRHHEPGRGHRAHHS